MMVALGFCHKDYLGAEKLFRWMAELDGQQQSHSLLLVASNGMEKERIRLVAKSANSAFHRIEAVMPRFPDERGWPISANHLFLTAYFKIKKMGGCPFLWIEPDCVPLKPRWIDSLYGEYLGVGKPFMGCVYELPWPHLTGCAIYPPEIETLNPEMLKPGLRAWDMVATEKTIPLSHHTGQFQHVWGNFKYNIAPTFPNHASMRLVREDAVLFHRCKDGSLIERLRERKKNPNICKALAKRGNPSNGFQDYEDSHAPAAVHKDP